MSGSLNRKRVLIAATTGWAGTLLSFAIRILLAPFVIHRLGNTDYGLIALVGSFAAQGALLDLGIGPAVTRHVAAYHAQKDYDSAHSLIATALVLYCGIGLVALVIGLVIAAFFPDIFNVPADERHIAVTVAMLAVVNIAISIPCATARAVLNGLHKYAHANALTFAWGVLSAAVTVVILLAGGGVIALVTSSIPITLAIQIATVWCVIRLAPELRFGFRGARRDMVRVLWSFSLSIFVMDVAYNIQTKIDEMIVGFFLPISAITPYSVARKLSEMPQGLVAPFLGAFVPVSSQLHTEGSLAQLKSLYLVGSRVHLALLTLLAGMIIALAGPILALWIGPAYAEYAPLAVILTLAYVIEFSHYPGGGILQGMIRHQPLAIAVSCTGAASLVLSVILVRPYGLIGVAIGTLVPTAALAFGYVWPYTARTVGVSLFEIVRRVAAPALLPAIPMAVAFYLVELFVEPKGLVGLGSVAAVGGLTYCVFYLAFAAGDAERDLIRASLARVRGMIARRAKEQALPTTAHEATALPPASAQAEALFDRSQDRRSDAAPVASIVITCFNHGRYLGEAIESAMSQTWPPLEIIVVDDGSTDDSPEVMKRYPSVIGIRQVNQGVSAARNTGLRACRGEYVLFLDADDLLLPEALEASIRAMNLHPDWGFVSGDFRYCDEQKNVVERSNFTEVAGDHYLALLRRNYVAMHAAVLYRRSVLDQVGGFDTGLRTAEDHEVYLRIARQFPVGQVRGLMALYRQHVSNTSYNSKRMLVGVIEVIARQRAYFSDDPRRWAAYRAGMQENCANYCRRFLLESFRRLARGGERREGLRGLMFLAGHPIWLWYTFWNKRVLRKLIKILAPYTGRWLLRFAP